MGATFSMMLVRASIEMFWVDWLRISRSLSMKMPMVTALSLSCFGPALFAGQSSSVFFLASSLAKNPGSI